MNAVAAQWPLVDGLYRSPLLERFGLVAGCTTASLGSMAGSVYPLEEQERARGALARGLGFTEVVRARQVHGARVLRVPFDGPDASRPASGLAASSPAAPAMPEADALWTDRAGLLLGVGVADCVPVLVADPKGGPIGAAHAGWQGTSHRIAAALVGALTASGGGVGLAAAIGPSIGPCCYVIDEQRAATVNQRLGAEFLRPAPAGSDGVAFLDLWGANAAQLEAAGVREVEIAGLCTRCGGGDTWSHRARGDRGPQGTALAVIGRPG